MGILDRRHQQGVFESATTINRRLNNASGVNSNAAASGYVGGITNVWSTVISTTILLPPPGQDLLVWAYVNYNRTSGTIVDTFGAAIVKDSDPDPSLIAFSFDASFQTASVPNDVNSRTFTLIGKYILLPAGSHTFKIRCTATGDTFQAFASIDIAPLSIAQS